MLNVMEHEPVTGEVENTDADHANVAPVFVNVPEVAVASPTVVQVVGGELPLKPPPRCMRFFLDLDLDLPPFLFLLERFGMSRVR
jgi:hypothetical protein